MKPPTAVDAATLENYLGLHSQFVQNLSKSSSVHSIVRPNATDVDAGETSLILSNRTNATCATKVQLGSVPAARTSPPTISSDRTDNAYATKVQIGDIPRLATTVDSVANGSQGIVSISEPSSESLTSSESLNRNDAPAAPLRDASFAMDEEVSGSLITQNAESSTDLLYQARALWPSDPADSTPYDLVFDQHDIIDVYSEEVVQWGDGWGIGCVTGTSQLGYFPRNFVEKLKA